MRNGLENTGDSPPPAGRLTGSRIRDYRLRRGMRQRELAQAAGISASYLNLIEHNRRRIGGKLVLVIAEALRIEPALLTEGGAAALTGALREAVAAGPGAPAVIDSAEEFASRYPGWAQVLLDRHRRVGELEHLVETLSDRLGHDPQLAASLHEVLSTVTAIRSTSAILHETPELEPAWRARFHRNIHEDSRRLAEGAQTLVSFLDAAPDAPGGTEADAPQDVFDAELASRGYHFPDLEPEARADAVEGGDDAIEAVIAATPAFHARPVRLLALRHLRQYRDDARALPLARMRAAIAEVGNDPLRLSAHLAADPARVMRRLAQLPEEAGAGPLGLAIADAAGALVFRREIAGFAFPRFAAACPLWPLFRAFARPMAPLEARVGQAGRGGGRFRVAAVAAPLPPSVAEQAPRFEAVMLIRPDSSPEGAEAERDPVEQLGVNCRLCARRACPARREASLLSDDFDR